MAFSTDYDGTPILLMSRLAEHRKNVDLDPRVSLMTQQNAADVLSGARVTLAGICERFDPAPALRNRYLRLDPDAGHLLQLDFDFHRITPTAVRYIGGFGKVHWLTPSSFLDNGPIDGAVEAAWLPRATAELAGSTGRRCVALDCDGVDVVGDNGFPQRHDFAEPLATPAALPAAIAFLQKGRVQ